MTIGSLASGVGLALNTVREHKMRSFLTVLGVIIGTGAVIGVGSIIAGLDGAITNILKSFGPNTIVVLRGSAMGGWTLEEMKRKPLTRDDALVIADRCPSVEHVSPYLFSNFDQIHKARYKGNDNYNLDIGGTEEGYAAGGTVMLQGRFFTDTESRHHMPVAVLGEDLGAWVRRLHESNGVVFHLGRKVLGFEGGRLGLDDGQAIEADFLVVGTGVRPRTALAEAAGLRVDHGVVVDDRLRCGPAGVFAVGDLARFPNPHTGALTRIEHWVHAERQGQHAARVLLGDDARYADAPFFWSAHYDQTIRYVGHAQGAPLVVHLLVAGLDEFLRPALQFLRGFLVKGLDLGQLVQLHIGDVLDGGEAFGSQELGYGFVHIQRFHEELGALGEFLLAAFRFLGLRQDVDLPAGKLGGQAHILPAAADAQR